MSLFSKILFFLLAINGMFLLGLLIEVRRLLMKYSKKKSYFMTSLFSDLVQLKRISKGKDCKHDQLINITIFLLLAEASMFALMIVLF